MSSIDRGRGSAPGKQKEPLSSGSEDPAQPYPDWLDRMQRTRARHAAITRNLNTRWQRAGNDRWIFARQPRAHAAGGE